MLHSTDEPDSLNSLTNLEKVIQNSNKLLTEWSSATAGLTDLDIVRDQFTNSIDLTNLNAEISEVITSVSTFATNYRQIFNDDKNKAQRAFAEEYVNINIKGNVDKT